MGSPFSRTKWGIREMRWENEVVPYSEIEHMSRQKKQHIITYWKLHYPVREILKGMGITNVMYYRLHDELNIPKLKAGAKQGILTDAEMFIGGDEVVQTALNLTGTEGESPIVVEESQPVLQLVTGSSETLSTAQAASTKSQTMGAKPMASIDSLAYQISDQDKQLVTGVLRKTSSIVAAGKPPFDYYPGQEVKAVVTGTATYGLFCCVGGESGYGMLIHHSEMPANVNTYELEDYFTLGEEITVKIVKVEPARQKLSGSLKGQVIHRKSNENNHKEKFTRTIADTKLEELKGALEVQEKKAAVEEKTKRIEQVTLTKEDEQIKAYISDALKPVFTADHEQALKDMIGEHGMFQFTMTLAQVLQEYSSTTNPINELFANLAYKLNAKKG